MGSSYFMGAIVTVLPESPRVSPVLTEASFVNTPMSPQQTLEVLVLSLPFGKNMLPSFSASPVRTLTKDMVSSTSPEMTLK